MPPLKAIHGLALLVILLLVLGIVRVNLPDELAKSLTEQPPGPQPRQAPLEWAVGAGEAPDTGGTEEPGSGLAQRELVYGQPSVPGAGSLTVELEPKVQAWGPFVLHLVDGSGKGPPRLVEVGEHVFQGLRGSPIIVHVEREGWVPLIQSVEIPEVGSSEGAGARLRLCPEPLCAIAGRVVHRDTGQGIERFSVDVEADPRRLEEGPVVVSAGAEFSTSDGSFLLADEGGGAEALRITVRAPGFLAASSEWVPVAGKRVEIAPLLLAPSGGAPLRGVVVGVAGGAIPGARVQFVPGTSPPRVHSREANLRVQANEPLTPADMALLDEDLAPLVSAVSGDNGEFELDLPMGAVGHVVAWAPGWATEVSTLVELEFMGLDGLRLVLESTHTLRVLVVQGAHLQRTVELRKVLVRQGAVASQAQLIETHPGDQSLAVYAAPVRADQPGEVEVWGRRRGPAEAGFADLALRRVQFGASVPSELHVFLAAGQGGSEITGRLLLPAPVLAERTLVALLRPGESHPELRCFVDEEGRIEFFGLEPGSYTLAALGYGANVRSPCIWSRTLDLEAESTLDLGALDFTALRRVRVLGAGEAVWSVVGLEGEVSPLERELLLRPEADGALQFYGLEPGSYLARRMGSAGEWSFAVSEDLLQTVELKPYVATNPAPR